MSKRLWAQEEIEKLKALYPNTLSGEIAKQLGCSLPRIYNKAQSLGLKKSKAFLSSEKSGQLQRADHRGRETQFKKGQAPWNKGMKGLDIGGKETRFKKGNKPHTWKPIGTERLSKEGYLQRKMSDTGITRKDYVAVHHLLWVEHRGEIPKGHAVCFIDGDKTNINIENLELVSRADLMKRNTVHRLPKELAEIVQLRGALQRQINKREGKHEQQHNQTS